MKKTCLIGDSHLGLLHAATSSVHIKQHHDLTFFPCPINYVSNIVLRGNKLVSTSDELTRIKQFSGWREGVDIESYDDFIIIGQDFGIALIVGLYRTYVSDSMPGPSDGKYLLSDECYLAVMEEVSCHREPLRLARSIRSVCNKPITVLTCPNPGLGMREEKIAKWYPPCHEAVRNGDDQALAALFREVCARIAKKNNLTIIPPISEAAANGVFNLREYCRLPEIIDDELDGHELMGGMLHGNDLYGRALLPYIFVHDDIEMTL